MSRTTPTPESFAGFYRPENMGFSQRLIVRAYERYKPFFAGESCLELGPAVGVMTRLLVESFPTVVAVDGAPSLVTQIPDHPRLSKVVSLFEDYEPARRFGTIVCNHVLEHIVDPVALLRRTREWLEPGGRLILGVPNAKSFHRLAAVHMGLLSSEYELNERDHALGHQRVYDMPMLKAHVADAGYEVVAEGGLFLKFLSNAQTESLLSPEITDAYFALSAEFPLVSAEVYVVAE